ncbi:uncharacterized protein EV422DRAFT_34358 [Fimicolochytrium jonesii]|uniref:uncharacterized protein n=1 Tax=Fimicolochytrium jonesii TaxID=1396493 RepID=UPI0022FDF172|nr:uncharacterized protein EV422DRAFT_34358 [Fimicolochytrium jonesii]KAI8827275.1 hypothetical protein EV422DRAFT_34358 [Fimicolochytrium jonesii]
MPVAYGAIPSSASPRPIARGRPDSEAQAGFIFGPPPPTLKSSLRFAFLSNWINVLLPFAPLGILAGLLKWDGVLVFVFNFFALLPMAKLLGVATEELALRTSQTIGGLLNATFGNAVEAIVGIIALNQGLLSVVKASLLGSILSNLLLVLGASFLAGGLYHKNQTFNVTGAQTSAALMSIVVMAFVLPAAFSFAVNDADKLLSFSRGTAVVLFIIYGLFLLFQLRTHPELFADEAAEEEEEPNMTLPASIALLIAVTLLVSLCGEYLVGSIEEVTEKWHLSQVFVGLILLPIVGNAAEHVTAVTVAMKDKMDLVIGVAIGSSMQIALLVTPLCVIFGWIIGQPLSLDFSAFETSVLFVSVFVVNSVIQDGRTNWLEGAMLLAAYVVVGIAFFVMPAQTMP